MKNKTIVFYSGKFLFLVSVIWLGFLLNQTAAAAAPGDLDPTFGTGGLVIATIAGAPASSDVAVQADGKIILASSTPGVNGYSDFAVLRLNADGTTDTAFGTVGKAVVSFGNLYNESVTAVAVQPDGKILAAGYAQPASSGYDFAVARFNSDGSLDTTFGAGGKTSFPVGIANDFVRDMTLQPDGKIILVGTGLTQPNSDAAIVRLNSGGTLDATFNGTGKLITPIGSGAANDTVSAVVVQTDGKILVAGSDGEDFAVLRFNPNGTFDATFDGDGKATTPIGTQRDTAKAIALQADGKIVVGGAANSGSGDEAALVRYNSDGSLDTTFGTAGGKLKMILPRTFVSVIIAADGKIIAVGTGGDQIFTGDFTLVRFNTDGSIDTTFGSGGKVTTTNGNNNITAYAAVAQTDGKIVVAGSGIDNSVYGFAIARYLTDSTARRATAFDFDGDGKADISVFRPTSGKWYLSRSAQEFSDVQFGASQDIIVPADYDGDGKTDYAVYRAGTWYLQRSNSGFAGIQFGLSTDVPVPADFDGDGKADLAVFRPSNGTWYVLNGTTNQYISQQWGEATDKPVAADYDGDGKVDFAVYRPSNGTWYILRSRDGFSSAQWGLSTDKPVVSDYDGDGKSDYAVYRPSNGTWYLLRSRDGFTSTQFGEPDDKPAPADYDGDGKTDVSVFRPSSGTWYQMRSMTGFFSRQFGTIEDSPAPNSFVR